MDSTVSPWTTVLTPINGSNQTIPEVSGMRNLIPALLITIALLGMAGNAVVLWLLGFRIQKNTFSVYILNLASADFLFLSTQIIQPLNVFIGFLEPRFTAFHSIFYTMLIFTYIVGMTIVSVISTERCMSALCPIWYHCHRPRHMSAIICALAWALSLLLSILEGYYCGTLSRDQDGDLCRPLDLIIATWLIFLFVLLSESSLALVLRMLCGSHQIQLTRLYLTTGLTVLVFLLCGLPWGIEWFLLMWVSYDDNIIPSQFYIAVFVLSSINSCANPIIYFFVGSCRQRKQRQRRSLKLVLQRALQDFPEVDQRKDSHPKEAREMTGISQVLIQSL